MSERSSRDSDYSPDYWDDVLAQVWKRKSVVLSTTVLLLLYAMAIYAPFLANDRPIYFRGTDPGNYDRTRTELAIVSRSLVAQVKNGSVDEGTLVQESSAILNRIQSMKQQLGPTDQTQLASIASALQKLTDLSRSGATNETHLAAGQFLTIVEKAHDSLAAHDGSVMDGSGVKLVPYTVYPVFENLSRGEIVFMVMWAIVLSFPLWNHLVNRFVLGTDRERIRRARGVKASALVVLPVLAALLWPWKPSAFYASPFKNGLTTGSIVAQTVIFPPIAFGISETNASEDFRPPTWARSARIDADGYYETGPRAGRFDAITRLPIQAQTVEVRSAELTRNHALRHAFGTDSLGRDIFTRLIWGARISLAVGLVSTLLLVTIGTFFGSLAGYYGGWVDTVLSRIIEIVQCFPVFFLILIVVAFVGPSILNIMLAIGLVRWTGVARLVRGEFIRLRGQEFVLASKALGVNDTRIIFRHVLPNALGPVLVAATFSVASGILTESALSFLGFGIQLPIPSWGSLLIESRSAEHWWIQIFPGLLIFVTVMLYNLLGEGVRDALDPRLRTL